MPPASDSSVVSAPGVSTKVMIIRPSSFAASTARIALSWEAGVGIP